MPTLTKAARRLRIANGYCSRCVGRMAEPGRTKCQRCIDYHKESRKTVAAARVADNLCPCCGGAKLPGKSGCARKLGYNKKLYYDRKAAKTCMMCDEGREPGHVYCRKHIDFNNQRAKKKRAENKRQAIAHYGGRCACCGRDDLPQLTIDHIGGGGREHRKEIGNGSAIYAWLVKNRFPEGFRVLCVNCNSAIGMCGYCPHHPEDAPELSTHKPTVRTRVARKRYKEMALDHYGRECACCGETTIEFLTLDHVGGGGQAHRAQNRGKSLWLWLYTNGYPDGFRILCWGCNLVIGIHGKCDH